MRRTLLLSLAALLFGSATAGAQREIRVATFTHPKSVTVTSVLQPFVDAVNAAAGDAVRLRGYWGGSLGRDPKKYYDLVRDGVADIGYFDPGYSPGRFKDFGLFELPFTARNGTEASIAMWRMYEMGLLGGLDEIKVLGVFSTDLYQIHTSKPVDTVFDLQGMKLRAAAPMHAEAVRALNGVPVGLPITTTTEALSRGVVDGALTGYSTLVTFRMLPVVKYHYDIPLGVVPVAVGMNKRSWESLPQKVKDAIDKHSGIAFSRNGGGGFDRAGERAIKRIIADKSRTRVPFSDADRDKGSAWAKPIYTKWISEVEDGQRKFDTYLKILDDIRKGR
jgi:TRAP-type C4-dicarboxylate transport system substrate-binding protein